MKLFLNLLGAIYSKIPKQYRPFIKKIVYFLLHRLQAVALFRRIYKARRVEFLDFEIAFLEDIEFIGPGPDQVLVEVLKTVVSPGTEKAVLCGLPGARRAFPYAPGYSAAGRILKVGKKVNGFKPGDQFAGRVGHSSHAVTTTNNLFHIPEGVSLSDAAFIELGIITLQGLRKTHIRPGERVAIVGQGLIGQLCNRFAAILGATEIIAVAWSRNRAKTALKPGGANEYIALSDHPGTHSSIKADVVIEAVGSPQAITTAFESARPGGRVILLGSSRGLGRNVNWLDLVQKKNLTVIGAHIGALPNQDASSGRWTYHQEAQLFLEFLQSGRLSVKDLVTWEAQPEECNAVYETIAAGGGKNVAILFDWHADSRS
jgi:2-desacetyl-2-hydroxyethyl bacteriochlorophyllide A dehydrogenase